MRGIIITAKHHDGFCLWPSEFTELSVKSPPWENSKGDVVRELSEACKEYGIEMGKTSCWACGSLDVIRWGNQNIKNDFTVENEVWFLLLLKKQYQKQTVLFGLIFFCN